MIMIREVDSNDYDKSYCLIHYVRGRLQLCYLKYSHNTPLYIYNSKELLVKKYHKRYTHTIL